jgi:hypothetical protein
MVAIHAGDLREGFTIALRRVGGDVPEQFLQGFPGGKVMLAGTLTEPGTQWIVHETANPGVFAFECAGARGFLHGRTSECTIDLAQDSHLVETVWKVTDLPDPDIGGSTHVTLQCQGNLGACSFGFLHGQPAVTNLVIRRDGLVAGADAVGTEIRPVFQFSGARIGFAEEDRFMLAIGNTLVVIRRDGLVFGAEVSGSTVQPVFQFRGARIGFAEEDRFMVTRLGSVSLVPQSSSNVTSHWQLILLPLGDSGIGGPLPNKPV